MITPELLLKIVLSSLIGYIALNAFFRYHFASERFGSIAIVLAMIVMYILKEYEDVNLIIIIFAVLGVLYLAFFLLFVRKQRFGYFLLNTSKKNYQEINHAITDICKQLEMDESNIIYKEKTAFYMEVRNIDYKKTKAFFKALDNWNNTRKKVVTMSVYWHLVAFLILMVAIWRF